MGSYQHRYGNRIYCTRLEFLNLAKNHISDIFPSWLWAFPALRVLSLRRSNRFYGIVGMDATDYLESSKLCTIDISNNAFSGLLPSDYMERWDCLKIGRRRRCNIPLRFLGDSVQQREKSHVQPFDGPYLKLVDFSSNKFEGKIPGTVGNLLGLSFLNLSDNILTGNIPSSLGYLTQLESLDLSRNQLSGEIPNTLAQLRYLAMFNVSHNHLTGPIPYVNQLATFYNSSYQGNSGLCGDHLSEKCHEVSENEENHRDPGLVSRLVVGIFAGNILTTSKHEWFVEKFSRRRRPHRKRKRIGHRKH
ncbi:hypothetical protein ACLB2K_022642 [Fragaria x ananassa]